LVFRSSFVCGLLSVVCGLSPVVGFKIVPAPDSSGHGFAISVTGRACAGSRVVRNVPKNKSRLPVKNPPVSGQNYPAAGSRYTASPDAVLCFRSFLTLRYKGKMLVSSCVGSTSVKIRAVGIRANAGF
jgi:hypothetical protein